MARRMKDKGVPEETVRLEGLRAAWKAAPQELQVALHLAWALYGHGDFVEATAVFSQAATLDLTDVEPVYGAAMARRGAGDKAAAIASFETALRLADGLQDRSRAQLLKRLAKGHINFLTTGDWNLEREVWRR